MDERTTRNVTQYQKMLLFPHSSKPRKVWNISKFHRDCDRQDHFIVFNYWEKDEYRNCRRKTDTEIFTLSGPSIKDNTRSICPTSGLALTGEPEIIPGQKSASGRWQWGDGN